MDNKTLLTRYIRIGLSLPILLPLLLMALGYLANLIDPQWLNLLPDWLMMASIIVVGSLFIGGIPYLLYYRYAWQFCKHRSVKQIYLFLLFSPIVFYLLQFVGLLIYDIYETLTQQQPFNLTHKLPMYASLSAFVFPIAYSYIVLILVAYHIRVKTIRYTHQPVGGHYD